MDFKMQLNSVADSYIALKNALVNSNVKAALIEAENFTGALSKTDMKLLSGENHSTWMGLLDKMKKSAASISSSKTIQDQRTAFADLSVQLYNSVKTFGLMGKTLYYQFCPMFKNGSYWLSETEEIKNPFYGNDMLTCGETKEVLKY
jgi:Cu(I)/Ag(I) efflux system membrane fusion protein